MAHEPNVALSMTASDSQTPGGVHLILSWKYIFKNLTFLAPALKDVRSPR